LLAYDVFTPIIIILSQISGGIPPSLTFVSISEKMIKAAQNFKKLFPKMISIRFYLISTRSYIDMELTIIFYILMLYFSKS